MIYIIKERTKVLYTCDKKKNFGEKWGKEIDIFEIYYLTRCDKIC